MRRRLALTLLCAALAGCFAAVEEPQPVEYVVVRGDTLFEIARAHGVTLDDLRAWNGLEGDLIEVGQVLVIHRGEGVAAPPPKAATRARPARAPAPAPAPAGLAMPPEQPCLEGPSLEGAADEAMAASQGLSAEAVRGAMGAFVHHTLACLDGVERYPTDALDLEITVACTGRVAEVRVLERADWTEAAAGCVAETLRYTPFPAHDLPDGETFRYPLRFTPG